MSQRQPSRKPLVVVLSVCCAFVFFVLAGPVGLTLLAGAALLAWMVLGAARSRIEPPRAHFGATPSHPSSSVVVRRFGAGADGTPHRG